jgi:hypothetical protein
VVSCRSKATMPSSAAPSAERSAWIGLTTMFPVVLAAYGPAMCARRVASSLKTARTVAVSEHHPGADGGGGGGGVVVRSARTHSRRR